MLLPSWRSAQCSSSRLFVRSTHVWKSFSVLADCKSSTNASNLRSVVRFPSTPHASNVRGAPSAGMLPRMREVSPRKSSGSCTSCKLSCQALLVQDVQQPYQLIPGHMFGCADERIDRRRWMTLGCAYTCTAGMAPQFDGVDADELVPSRQPAAPATGTWGDRPQITSR